MLGASCTGRRGLSSLGKQESSSARLHVIGRLANSWHTPPGGQPRRWRPPDQGGSEHKGLGSASTRTMAASHSTVASNFSCCSGSTGSQAPGNPPPAQPEVAGASTRPYDQPLLGPWLQATPPWKAAYRVAVARAGTKHQRILHPRETTLHPSSHKLVIPLPFHMNLVPA
ncbi:uncharacterized protein [Dermacentor albipictus]|uniref:uncharacterized protein n=1 Tax=Dermacentor albipictus TaxID=60249 RepID=UPI0031FD604A